MADNQDILGIRRVMDPHTLTGTFASSKFLQLIN
jgi:hypothetical protein